MFDYNEKIVNTKVSLLLFHFLFQEIPEDDRNGYVDQYRIKLSEKKKIPTKFLNPTFDCPKHIKFISVAGKTRDGGWSPYSKVDFSSISGNLKFCSNRLMTWWHSRRHSESLRERLILTCLTPTLTIRLPFKDMCINIKNLVPNNEGFWCLWYLKLIFLNEFILKWSFHLLRTLLMHWHITGLVMNSKMTCNQVRKQL